jgi:hypothetical protein
LAPDPQRGGILSLKAIQEALDVFPSDAYISGISDNSDLDKTWLPWSKNELPSGDEDKVKEEEEGTEGGGADCQSLGLSHHDSDFPVGTLVKTYIIYI